MPASAPGPVREPRGCQFSDKKSPGTLTKVPGPFVYVLGSRVELRGCSVLGPAIGCEPGKHPGPPPGAVSKETVSIFCRGSEATRIHSGKKSDLNRINPDGEGFDQAFDPGAKDLVDPNH